jgi:hypothetical protein
MIWCSLLLKKCEKVRKKKKENYCNPLSWHGKFMAKQALCFRPFIKGWEGVMLDCYSVPNAVIQRSLSDA